MRSCREGLLRDCAGALVAIAITFAGGGGRAAGQEHLDASDGDDSKSFMSLAPILEMVRNVPLSGVQLSLQPDARATFDATVTTMLLVTSAQMGLRVAPVATWPYAYGRVGVMGVTAMGGEATCYECASERGGSPHRVDFGVGYTVTRNPSRPWFVEGGGSIVDGGDERGTGLRVALGYGLR